MPQPPNLVILSIFVIMVFDIPEGKDRIWHNQSSLKMNVNEWMIEWKKQVYDHPWRPKMCTLISNDIYLVGVHFVRDKLCQCISFSEMKNNNKSASLSKSHALHFLWWVRSFEPLTGVLVFGFEFFPSSDNWVLSLKSPFSVPHPSDSRLSPT